MPLVGCLAAAAVLNEGSGSVEKMESQWTSASAQSTAHQTSEENAGELRFLRAQLADEKAAREAAEAQLRKAGEELQKLKADMLGVKDQQAATLRQHEATLEARFNENAILMKSLKTAQDREEQVQLLVAQVNKAQLLFTRLLNALLQQAAPRYLPANIRLQRKCELMEKHSLFDPVWYLNQNPDVAEAGVDAAEHFVSHGLREGRSVNRTMEDLRRSVEALQGQRR